MTTKDPYTILGLPSSASRQQIRDRYFSAVSRGIEPTRARELKDAYDLLIDPARRSFYDMTQRINHNMDERAELLRREAELRERERRELAEAEAQRLRVYADFEEERRRGRATSEEQNQTAINYGTDNKDRPPVYAPQPLYPTLPAEHTPLFSTSNRNTGEPRSSKRPGFWKAFSAVIPYILPCTVFTGFVILFLVYLCNLLAAHQPIPQPKTPAPPPPPPPVPYERRIAIIGAGPAGVSVAYHLSHLASLSRVPHHISLYERSTHIGGRSVQPVTIVPGEFLDLGATTFSKTSSLLSKAADYLGLNLISFDDGTGDLVGQGKGNFGVYDGRSWSYLEPNPGNFFGRGWWSFKLWYFYGRSPGRAEDLITAARKARERLYASTAVFESLSNIIHEVGLDEFSKETGESLLHSHDVDENFQREIFNPWIRGRYAQNLGTISALGAMMAADNSAALKVSDEEGMAGLWERMVASTGGAVHLDTHVIGLRTGDWGGWVLASSDSTGQESYEPFDAIVLATPWSLTKLEIRGDPVMVAPQEVEYAEMYITLFTTTHDLSGNEFSGQKGMPELVLTTPCSWEYKEISGGTGKDGMGHAPFWFLSRVKEVVRGGQREYLYKIVSAEEISDDEIRKLLGGKEGEENRWSWVYRYHSPAAHPLLTPREKFSDIVLDENLWYTGGIDELTTGVEMASIMGNNVAELVVRKWRAEGNFPPDERRIPKEGPPGVWNRTVAKEDKFTE